MVAPKLTPLEAHNLVEKYGGIRPAARASGMSFGAIRAALHRVEVPKDPFLVEMIESPDLRRERLREEAKAEAETVEEKPAPQTETYRVFSPQRSSREGDEPIMFVTWDAMASTREAWLRHAAWRLVTDIMAPNGYGFHADLAKVAVEEGDSKESWTEDEVSRTPLTEEVMVSCGWPSSGGTRRKRMVIGQCWNYASSADGKVEIFISPTIADGQTVLATLLHELLHAAVGTKAGHRGPFKKGCDDLGLEGKPTATHAGESLAMDLQAILDGLPPYPHAAMRPTERKKSQKTRFLKAFCANEECATQGEGGFKVRITRLWVDAFNMGEDAEGDTRISLRCPACAKDLKVETLPEEDPE